MVGHISPEAMVGGPISIVKNGDNIEIDLDKGVIDLKISNKEFSKRIEKLESFEIRYKTGALAKFATLVQSDFRWRCYNAYIKKNKKTQI